MKSLLAVILAALTSIMVASAQTMPAPGTTASTFGPDPIIQITTTFHAPIEGLADPRTVPTTTAQAGARRTLYNMAANECIVLAEFWKAECRLNSLSVYVALADTEGRDTQSQAPSMFGTALYELRLTSLPGR